ncbi:MAG: IS481 family transposase, partial [Pseudomonadota bacterium]
RVDMICTANEIDHRLTKLNQPRTHGQVERRSHTIQDGAVKSHRDNSHDQRRSHIADVRDADTFARRLKTLSGLTPYTYICKT